MAQDLTKLFNKFAGKEVSANEAKHGRFSYVLADPTDQTIQAMESLAKANGLTLRLWFPGTMGTMDFNGHRINAHVTKEADGKYRVSSNFSIG